MKKLKDSSYVTFSPEKGLFVGKTAKEGMQELINTGFFDTAKSVVVAISDDTHVDFRSQGSRFEAMSLAHYLQCELDDIFEKQ